MLPERAVRGRLAMHTYSGVNRLNDLSALASWGSAPARSAAEGSAEFIEARLLELSHTTDVKITAPTLAYYAPCSIENAQKVLDDLTAKDQLQMDVQDDGSIVYEMLGRQKLPENLRPLRREVGLVPAPPQRLLRARASNPLVAALLSLWIPGAGHLYAGRVVAAVLWFLVVGAGYALILPGLILHMFAIVSAAASSARRNVELMLAGQPNRRLVLAA